MIPAKYTIYIYAKDSKDGEEEVSIYHHIEALIIDGDEIQLYIKDDIKTCIYYSIRKVEYVKEY